MRFQTAENNLQKALMAYILAEMAMMAEPFSNRKAQKAQRAKVKFMEAVFTWGKFMGSLEDARVLERYRHLIGLAHLPAGQTFVKCGNPACPGYAPDIKHPPLTCGMEPDGNWTDAKPVNLAEVAANPVKPR